MQNSTKTTHSSDFIDTPAAKTPRVSDNTLLLVDGSSYLYRAFHALPDMRNTEGKPTGAIYGLLNMLRKLRQDYPAKYCACVFDAKGKTFRDDLYPEYKAHRSPMPPDLVEQIEPIHQAVAALGWPILVVPHVEADDVIGTLASYATAHDLYTIVSTGDKDLAQLVNERVTLINTMNGETLDPPAVTTKFGVSPAQIVDYLTLIGDTVDNVPGVNKVGPKTAVKWLTQYGSLDAIVAHANEIKGAVGEHLRNALTWLPMAHRLLTVKIDCDLTEHAPNLNALLMQQEDMTFLISFFQQYGFRTWLREMEKKQAQIGNTNAILFETNSPQSALSSAPSALLASSSQQATQDNLSFELPRHYETITSEAQLIQWLEKIQAASLTAFDTETTSLSPLEAQLVGISLAVDSTTAVKEHATPTIHACYIPLQHCGPDQPQQLNLSHVLETLRPWMENPRALKVGQNLKYDAHVLLNHGIQLRGIAHDTLLQSYVLEAHRSHDLDSLAERHLGITTIKYADVCGKGAHQIGFDQVDIAKASEYAAEDAEVTLRLHQTLWPQLETNAKLRFIYEQIELPALETLLKIERNGVLINSAQLAMQSKALGEQLLALETQAHALAGQAFNLNSPKQIGEILFTQLQLPVVKKTASGAPSTDEDVLQKLAADYPLPKLLLEHRGLAKLKSTYTDKLPRMVNSRTGRVHTNYAQAVAVTGRLASNDPNLQNIPIRNEAGRKIREAFIAPTNKVIISADYSQIELRIMAHLSDDASLITAFNEGQDIHQATAAEIFSINLSEVSSEQRRYAKTINFGLIYGMSAFGLASNLGIERSAAQRYIDTYFARYPKVAQYMDSTRQYAKQHGYVETLFGRRLWLPEINSPNGPRRQAAERAAINAPMQGTAADLIKRAMVAVQIWLTQEKLTSQLIMQVHDELVLEVPESEIETIKTHLSRLMCTTAELKIPLVVDIGIGNNWDEAH